MLFFDFETFKYDWLVVAIDPINAKEFVVVNDKKQLEQLYQNYKSDIWVGFNCRNYDQYILKAILLGFNPKTVNDWIIVKDRKGWEFSTLFNTINLNLYDVMPNPPIGLKTLEGFMGNNIHETSVPFDIDRKLTDKELKETIRYCRFDVFNTIEVFMRRKNEFDSQLELVKTFKLPLNCLGKTQAQLAAIILGAKKKRFKDEWAIRLPDTAQLGRYKNIGNWFLDKANHCYDCKLDTEICGLTHTIAWGGIHAGVKKYHYKCKPHEVILDIDVDQLYPTLMIRYGLLSRAVEEPQRFKNILETSLRLKKEGKKKEREPYKRICNITYGAEGDKFNPMYDPLHRNLVCVFGQVLIIDLLEKIEDLIELLQSNTDGIFIKIDRSKLPELKRRIESWEKRTGLKMSYDEFEAMYAKDVNNYIAVRKDGSYHCKGAYVKQLSPLDYDLPIVNEAMKNYILKGIPVERTVNCCVDMIKFQKIVKLSNKYKWVEHEQEFNTKQKYGCELGYSMDFHGYCFEAKRGYKGENSCVGCKHYKKLTYDSYNKTVKYYNKAYRVFASKDPNDGRLLKCDGIRNPAKFGNTPDHCFVWNEDVKNADIPDKLDRQYYINLTKKRLEDFGL